MNEAKKAPWKSRARQRGLRTLIDGVDGLSILYRKGGVK